MLPALSPLLKGSGHTRLDVVNVPGIAILTKIMPLFNRMSVVGCQMLLSTTLEVRIYSKISILTQGAC